MSKQSDADDYVKRMELVKSALERQITSTAKAVEVVRMDDQAATNYLINRKTILNYLYEISDINYYIQESQVSEVTKKLSQSHFMSALLSSEIIHEQDQVFFHSPVENKLDKTLKEEFRSFFKRMNETVEDIKDDLQGARQSMLNLKAEATQSKISREIDLYPVENYQLAMAQAAFLDRIRHSLLDEIPFWNKQVSGFTGPKVRLWDASHTQSEVKRVADGIGKVITEVLDNSKYTMKEKLDKVQTIFKERYKDGKKPLFRTNATHDYYALVLSANVNDTQDLIVKASQVKDYVKNHKAPEKPVTAKKNREHHASQFYSQGSTAEKLQEQHPEQHLEKHRHANNKYRS